MRGSVLTFLGGGGRRNIFQSTVGWGRSASSSSPTNSAAATQQQQKPSQDEEEFRTLDIIKSNAYRFQRRKRRERREVPPPRYLKMPVDQDWPSVWPTAKTFHPASVPLPLHQGYVPDHLAPPGKFANAELMKIPNFLHLTPPAIQRHCEALKKFCTPWPKELQEEEVLEALFPVEITTNDYCHSSPNIRDERARIVTLQIKLSSLNLDYHARDKMMRLVGERYDPQSDILTIVTQNCPLRKQNYDYAMYMLTALYHESHAEESWESDKGDEDMERYVWEGSASQKSVDMILGLTQGEGNPVSLTPAIEKYRDIVVSYLNEGEELDKVDDYAKSVREMLNLPLPSS